MAASFVCEASRMRSRSSALLWARASSTTSEASTKALAAPRSMSGMRKRAARFLSQPSGRDGPSSPAASARGSSVSLNVSVAQERSLGTANISL